MNFRIASAVLMLTLLFASASIAQTSDTASLRGHVSDPAGARVAGATVTLENIATGARRAATSDAHGDYVFATLPVTGNYQLRIAHSGFTDVAHGPFALRAGETATVDVTLNATAAVNEGLTVYGTVDGVRSDSPELGTRLEESALRNVPILGRKLTNLPLLNSAVRPARGTGDLFLNNTLFVINGGGRRQATYALDGVAADDAWGRQTIFTNVPLATVREVNVLTNAFSAEYGRTTGGAINVVTRSGTNDMQADFVGTDRPTTADKLKQGSGMISGPIVADRTHFLAGIEYSKQNRQSLITSTLAPGVFTGDYKQTLAIVRLDHELNAANHLLARANVDRFTDSNPADAVGGVVLPSAARTFRRDTSTILLSESAIVSSSMFNELRGSRNWGDPITEFEPANPSTQFVRPGVSTEGESRSARLFNHQYQLADTLTWALGHHSLRIGGDYVRSTSGGNGQEFGSPFVLGQFTFKTGIPATTPTSALTLNDVQRFSQGFGNVSYEVTDTNSSLFVQDDWHPMDRLTVNLGGRYDRQKLTGDSNLSPRLGFAYNVGRDGRTVVRGGYGHFYSQVQSNTVASWALGGPTGFFTYSVAPGQLGFPTTLGPISSFPTGASLPARDVTIRPGQAAYYSQFFDVSKLRFYPGELRNPKTAQSTIGFEREIAPHWFFATDFVYAHTTDILRNLDANAPAAFDRTTPGQTRTAGAADLTRPIVPVANGYRRILVTTNLGESKYRGLQVSVRRTFTDSFGVSASYTRSHATNNIEADAPGGDPNDVNLLGREWADSLLDQRNRGVIAAWKRVPFGIVAAATVTMASGRPYNITTGTDNNGDGANTDRPVIDGVVIGRNQGRGTSIFQLDASLEKDFLVRNGVTLGLRAEGFNLTDHANVVGRNGVYGNTATPLPTLGAALGGISNVDPGRQYQFALTVRY